LRSPESMFLTTWLEEVRRQKITRDARGLFRRMTMDESSEHDVKVEALFAREHAKLF
jgi:hypothetical protein